MKKLITLFFILGIVMFAQNKHKISGQVTDFDGNPVDSALVRLMNEKFDNLYVSYTDKNGNYEMLVDEKEYYVLYCIKPAEYGKTRLEYWAWNVPMFSDLTLNPQYHRMEAYAMNAFIPQVGPNHSYMLYFRPMGLTKALENKLTDKDLINWKDGDIKVLVNNLETEVLQITPVVENTTHLSNQKQTTFNMRGYLLQFQLPKNNKQIVEGYDQITLVITDPENGDKGKGDLFVRNPYKIMK